VREDFEEGEEEGGGGELVQNASWAVRRAKAAPAWGLPSAGEGASLSRFVQRCITSSDCGLRALRMTSSFSFTVIVLFFSGKGGCLARTEAISISSATAQPHTPSCCAVGESELKMNPWQSPQFRNRG